MFWTPIPRLAVIDEVQVVGRPRVVRVQHVPAVVEGENHHSIRDGMDDPGRDGGVGFLNLLGGVRSVNTLAVRPRQRPAVAAVSRWRACEGNT